MEKGLLVKIVFVALLLSVASTILLFVFGRDASQKECRTFCTKMHTVCDELPHECPLVKECCVDDLGECVPVDYWCEYPVYPSIQQVRRVLNNYVIPFFAIGVFVLVL